MLTIYNDDLPGRPPDCRIESNDLRHWAEMLVEVGRMEKAKSAEPPKLIGIWSPRKALEEMKERASVQDGARSVLVCIDRRTERPVLFWSDTCADQTYELANLRANGFVLGVLVFYPSGQIDCIAEPDPEMSIKQLLLDFFARCLQCERSEETQADKILAIGSGDAFSPENVQTTLDKYSELSDQYPIKIEDICTVPVLGANDAR